MKLKRALLVLCAVVVLAVLGFKVVEAQRLSKAKAAAVDYAQDQYGFEVECTGGEFRWIDPSQYYIYLRQKDGERLSFFVNVGDDLAVYEEHVTDENRYTADNYLHRYFGDKLETYIKGLLSGDPELERVEVVLHNPAVYGAGSPKEIDLESGLEEVLQEWDMDVVGLYYRGLDDDGRRTKLKNAVKALREQGVDAGLMSASDAEDPEKTVLVNRDKANAFLED